MQPFSFKEYYNAHYTKKNHKPLQEIYLDYIKESSFPQTVKFKGNQQYINDYLINTVYLNTIQKDIIQRFNISDINKLTAVINYLFDNIGKATSLRNIERGLKTAGHKISVPTIDNYLKGLIDSYLIYKCDRFDIKGKRYLDTNSKYYVADIGLRTALLGHASVDMGYILENIVYLELVRREYRVSVGKVNTKIIKEEGKSTRKVIEVDFVAQKAGENIEYYQVALYALNEETLKRELSSLEELNDNYPKFLLSLDYGKGEIKGVSTP